MEEELNKTMSDLKSDLIELNRVLKKLGLTLEMPSDPSGGKPVQTCVNCVNLFLPQKVI